MIMAKHIDHNLREYQLQALAMMTARKFKDLYEQQFPIEDYDEETDKNTDMR